RPRRYDRRHRGVQVFHRPPATAQPATNSERPHTAEGSRLRREKIMTSGSPWGGPLAVSVIASWLLRPGGCDGRLLDPTAGSCEAHLPVGRSDLLAGVRAEAADGGLGVPVPALA